MCVIHSPMPRCSTIWRYFFFSAAATTEISTLSLHDALPILLFSGYRVRNRGGVRLAGGNLRGARGSAHLHQLHLRQVARSEEHTSELQSHHDLVCRLLLEKKKQPKSVYILNAFSVNVLVTPH